MGREIEDYISRRAGRNLKPVFDEYLRTTMVPTFEYRLRGDTLEYRWADVVAGFDMPVKATLVWPELAWLHPTTTWQRTRVKLPNASDFRLDPNFYVNARPVGASVGTKP
jgi:hypothetical protein